MNVTDPHSIQTPAFDRELSLEALLEGCDLDRLIPALATLLGTPFRLLSADGEFVCGDKLETVATRVPLCIELEPIAYLEVQDTNEEQLLAAAGLVELVLRGTARYLMVSGLHSQTVQTDYEELQRRHQALEASEQRYRELAKTLEQRVADQVDTIETTQRQLYQAEKLSAVGQLAAGVAHEINNPIGFVMSNLNTARDYLDQLTAFAKNLQQEAGAAAAWREAGLDTLLTDFHDLLRESLEGSERVARIVRDLMGFSNTDATIRESVDINACVQTVCNMTSGEINRYAELVLELGELPSLYCQPGYLAQALLSLLLNADRAVRDTGRQDGKIRVQTRFEPGRDGETDEIGIRITDNGAGMAPDTLTRVFDPFFTTHDVGEGTGLGLTLSRDIIQAHGGRIEVESEPGVGTTVNIYLPIEVASKE
ncbi:MAG: hypothetical protein BMS9Abin36_0066 [Gammaproteobacteria bacterium]|nr:MAG: hypothetical protein BMS9Abin36_0066 [Gammaproteobacteria bacterium]